VELGLRRSFKILAPGSSLRRRVAYSLAIVRLVLVPVIFLAVYYRLGTSEQEITELRLAVEVKADDFAIEHAAVTLQVTSQSFAQSAKAFEGVSVPRDEPHAARIGMGFSPPSAALTAWEVGGGHADQNRPCSTISQPGSRRAAGERTAS
jgi:hypothetical protein